MHKNGMRPVHPGEVLREDYLKPFGMSANALANALSVTPARIQAGMHARAFENLYLGTQEVRILHFHKTLEEYLGRGRAGRPVAMPMRRPVTCYPVRSAGEGWQVGLPETPRNDSGQ